MLAPRALDPSRTLADAPLGQGGQIQELAAAPRAERIALLGNQHLISVVDVAAGRITATLACSSAVRGVLAFEDDEHLLAFDTRGLVRLGMDGASTVLLPDTDRAHEDRVQDVLVHGDRTVVLERRGHDLASPTRARVIRAGATTATITYALADHAAALGLAAIDGLALIVNAAALTPDGARIVALAAIYPVDYTRDPAPRAVLVHDLDGNLLHARAVPPAAVNTGSETGYVARDLAFAPDGRRFAVVGGTVRTFDATTGELLHDDALLVDGAPMNARRVIMLGGDELLVACETHVGRWTPGAPEATAARAYREHAFVMAMTATRTAVAIGDNHGLLLFSLPDLRPLHEPVGHIQPVSLLAVDERGARVASADGSSLIVWDLAAGAPLFRRPARCWAGLAFAPDGRELMAAIDGARPHVLDAATGEVRVVGEARATAFQWGEQPWCLSCEKVERGEDVVDEIVVAAGREAHVRTRLQAPYLRCVPALSRDGRRALVFSDTRAYGWDLERGVQLWERPLELVHATLTPDGAFALVTRFGAPAVIDMATGEPLLALHNAGSTISWAMAWSAQGDRLAVGADGGDVYLVELDDPKQPAAGAHVTRLRTGHRPEVNAVAFSGDGTLLVTGGAEGTIRVFELGATRPVAVPRRTDWPAAIQPGATVVCTRGEHAGRPLTVLRVDRKRRKATLELGTPDAPEQLELAVDDIQ